MNLMDALTKTLAPFSPPVLEGASKDAQLIALSILALAQQVEALKKAYEEQNSKVVEEV